MIRWIVFYNNCIESIVEDIDQQDFATKNLPCPGNYFYHLIRHIGSYYSGKNSEKAHLGR